MPTQNSETVTTIAGHLQGLDFGGERAAELYDELRRLNDAVLAEVEVLSFDLEPAHFVALLTELAR